jgi:hypothetical protein
MDYKIVNFIADEGKVEVYYSEGYPPISIDVPFTAEGLFISGQELDTYIKGFIPTWHFERLDKLKAGIPNAAELAALVEAVPPAVVSQEELLATEEANRNSAMWAQQQFESQVAKALVKFGVLNEDPTVIPVSVS